MQEVSGGNVLASHFPSVPLWKALALEGLANRDSLPYAEEYGLGPVDHLTDLFRGTLRFVDYVKNTEPAWSLFLSGIKASLDFWTRSEGWDYSTPSLSRQHRQIGKMSCVLL